MAFNAATYKATTRQQWQDAAEAWNAWGGFLATWLGPATDVMLDMAKVGQGSAVLDIAAGAGQQTLVAAQRAGPSGRILATDISPDILEYALENARIQGLHNVETLEADGEDLDVAPDSFDAAISRVGLIYFPDQQRALTNIMRALRPGGRFAAIVYSTPENNGFFSKPISIIRDRAQLPPPAVGQPGPFSIGSPGALTSVLESAGFRDIEEKVISAPVVFPKAADCLRFERESFGALHQMLSGIEPEAQEAVWAEIGDALSEFETADGFIGPCELVVAAGTK
ncbi:class I SAM-dependent methyltransferase [Pacificibacter sp.]|uniref:class I SAM-dependent methyltransferase n=1 Tax=Pacificibacter sp. TaxID=1917866 RepID=UPI00321A80BA